MVSPTASLPRLDGRAPNAWLVGVVCGMASYIDAAAIFSNGIALVIYQHSIGVTPDQIGVMSGALIFCIAFGALFGGRLGDQFGRRRVFLVTMILIALGSALLTFGTEYPPLLTGVILVGLATGADLPVSLATIAEAATDKNRGAILVLSNILWVVGIISAIAIASVVGGWGRLGGQILYAQLGAVPWSWCFCVSRFPNPSCGWRAATSVAVGSKRFALTRRPCEIC